MARLVVVAFLSLLAVAQVARQAYVGYYGSTDPEKARVLWANHPDISFKADLDEIARISAGGQDAPLDRIEDVMESAARAPLATEPFLVRGVQAVEAGHLAVAQRAFEAARRRDPRSVAARYFLAEHYLKANKVDQGLRELGVLTNLVPNSLSAVAPYFAAFAKSPGGASKTKAMLRSHPDFEGSIMAVLAADARNADLILFLANEAPQTGKPPAWHEQLVRSLIASGQYKKARTVWGRLGGVKGTEALLYDPSFSNLPSLPPFGWTLSSSGAGSAEPEREGRLHVIYYGRDDLVLASQLLLLRPNRYNLSLRAERGADATSLGWRVACRPSNQSILDHSVGKIGAGAEISFNFVVPNDCPAQSLELVGMAPEFPETVDLTISNLSIAAVGQ